MRCLFLLAITLGVLSGMAFADTKANCDQAWNSLPSAYRKHATAKQFYRSCLNLKFHSERLAAASEPFRLTESKSKADGVLWEPPGPGRYEQYCLAHCQDNYTLALNRCSTSTPDPRAPAACKCSARDDLELCNALCSNRLLPLEFCPSP